MIKTSTFAAVLCLFLGGSAMAQSDGATAGAGSEQMGGAKSTMPDGTGVNPYSGKEVGEPLKPGDLGYGAPAPKTITEE